MTPRRWPTRPVASAAGAILACLLAACSGEVRGAEEGQGGGTPPNLVLVTVDTLRADHLSVYGYHRDTTPGLRRLAEEGLVFRRAHSTMGTTMPAHLSLMTGLLPHQHGYVANHGAMDGGFRSEPGLRTVAELLVEDGYTTAAFVSGPTVGRATGLDAGFQHFDQHRVAGATSIAETARHSSETANRAIRWLEEGPQEPFFLWVHFWDTHEPNVPREPYASAFQADVGVEALLAERRVRPEVLAERFSEGELARLFLPEWAVSGGEIELPPIDMDAVRDLYDRYDGDVLAVDAAIGRVLVALHGGGHLERSAVVVTADHGQALGQHDWLEHGRIQQENLRVPLVMRFPPGTALPPGTSERLDEVVSLVDVMPTVLARLELPAAGALAAQATGEDVLGVETPRGYAFAQRSVRDRDWEPCENCDGLKYALVTRRWKLYHRPEGADELYDLEADPGELVDVAALHPPVVENLRRRLLAVAAERPRQVLPGGEVDPEVLRRYRETLGQIGYTGE